MSGTASRAARNTGRATQNCGGITAAGGVYTYVEEDEKAIGVVGMVVGGALLAVGIPFMVIGGADAEPDAQAITLQPQIGPGWVGLSGQF